MVLRQRASRSSEFVPLRQILQSGTNTYRSSRSEWLRAHFQRTHTTRIRQDESFGRSSIALQLSNSRTRINCTQPRNTPWVSQLQTRSFISSPTHHHGDLTPPKPGFERHITFIDKEGQSHTFEVADGDNLLDIAQANDLEMEGACGGSCACSTCHVIVRDDEMYDRMEEPSDDENDMLDLAFGLTETSRLGCQVVMSEGLDGVVVCITSLWCWTMLDATMGFLC